MAKFNITDIVKLKEDDNKLYMIIDILGFITSNENKNYTTYELMEIYPIHRVSKCLTVSEEDIDLKERNGSNNYEKLLKFIQKDREKRGYYGVPDFISASNYNLKNKKEINTPVKKLDTIRYDMIDNIDSCLDAINDLDTLYKMFGDEAYLQLKELVTNRIIRLQK